MNKILLTGFATITVAASLRGQSFTNLNFEDADVSQSSGFVATSDALPGWSAFSGTNQLSTVVYNASGLASYPVTLLGSNSFVLDGNFSVSLVGGSISQTGPIPSGSQSLLFDAASPYLLVSLGSENLSYTAIASDTNSYGLSYSTYVANISAFAGQTETLTFSSLGPGQGGILDDIQFSPEAIPEPSMASLFFLGSGVLFYVRKRRQTALRC